MQIPSIYERGYQAALAEDAELAQTYIRYTMIGDPMADQVVEELEETGRQKQAHAILSRALANSKTPGPLCPESLSQLIEQASVVPDWYDRKLAMVATGAFLRNPEVVLAGLAAGSIVEGFSTLISKSFFRSGRLIDSGVRRLKQNNLHLLDQFLPLGLEPGGDGWRLTLRIRLVHAQSRRMLRMSGEWDESKYGCPLSSAHMLLGAAAFSGRLMQHVRRLGGRFTAEEQEAYVHVWRLSGMVMGIPESIMFRDFDSSLRVFRIGSLCEPDVADEAIVLANSIVNSVPLVLGVTEPAMRRKDSRRYYQVSRELIGDALADGLRFPAKKRIPLLPLMRLRYFLSRIVYQSMPRWIIPSGVSKFNLILRASDLGTLEHSYRLPTAVSDEESDVW